MTTISQYNCAASALLGSLKALENYGQETIVRNMLTTEILGYTIKVSDPTARFTLLPFRKCNPFAQIAETMWMLAGREDLDWLEFYIPSCKKWSDDGNTWRDAYGPRLRKYGQQYEVLSGMKIPVGESVDQLSNVVNKLKQDIYSRQVILTIWNPDIDWVEGSKAYPCNIALQFLVRDNQLHMFVTLRSNDVIYGFSHNDFFSWSVLHQLMAKWVGATVGNLHWNAASFHIYERHYELSSKIIAHTHPRQYLYDFQIPRFQMLEASFESFDSQLANLFTWERTARDRTVPELIDSTIEFSADPFMDACIRMLILNVEYKTDSYDIGYLLDAVRCIPYSDFKIAAIDFLCRDDNFELRDFSHLIHSADVYDYLRDIESAQSQF